MRLSMLTEVRLLAGVLFVACLLLGCAVLLEFTGGGKALIDRLLLAGGLAFLANARLYTIGKQAVHAGLVTARWHSWPPVMGIPGRVLILAACPLLVAGSLWANLSNAPALGFAAVVCTSDAFHLARQLTVCTTKPS